MTRQKAQATGRGSGKTTVPRHLEVHLRPLHTKIDVTCCECLPKLGVEIAPPIISLRTSP